MPLTFEAILEEAYEMSTMFSNLSLPEDIRINFVHAVRAVIAYVNIHKWQSYEVLLLAPHYDVRAASHRQNFQALFEDISGEQNVPSAIARIRQHPNGVRFFAAVFVKAFDAENNYSDDDVDLTKRRILIGDQLIHQYRQWKNISAWDHWQLRLCVTTEAENMIFYGARSILQPEEVLETPELTDDEEDSDNEDHGVVVMDVDPQLQNEHGN